ncbi:chloramphenicol phosphotransferase CPT family protein [Deinococcus puniceus]|uniref:Chloramphenicol phosphotransferase n=1 Tax=Deinococcus puniceus TaxID=1182568 RepID=A0A172TBA6_9DEIO|nr:AAA family ATPase [Deinococcus puniceus]ANE44214.1 hypothetical protein SU48_11070 [Deinococcus puniceus]
MTSVPLGKVILLNGPSSAGKSTLCAALQDQLDEPFLQFSLDFLMFRDGVLPQRREASGPFSWAEMRPKLFEGYYNCLPALLSAGNNLVLDYIIESSDQWRTLLQRLGGVDVFLVGVHCPLPELERREQQRGDRRIGDARRDFATVHTFSSYDLEVDSLVSPQQNAKRIVEAWSSRTARSVFGRAAQRTVDRAGAAQDGTALPSDG